MYKQVLLNKVLEYFKFKKLGYKQQGKMLMLDCVFCNTPLSANKIPNSHKIYCHKCKESYDLINIVKKIENIATDDPEEIYTFLKETLSVDIETKNDGIKIEKLFNYYQKNEFSLTPVAKNNKNPIEKDWPNKEHHCPSEWNQWKISGLNIGLVTGQRSGVTVLDIDALTKKEKEEYVVSECTKERRKELENIRTERLNKVIAYLNIKLDTLYQDTLGGRHYIYKYEKELPKCQIEVEDVKIDVENDGGMIVVAPSILPNTDRVMYFENEITVMPANVKEYCLAYNPPKYERSGNDNTDDDEIDLVSYEGELKDLDGKCNNTFASMGGLFIKELNPAQTAFVLKTINRNMLADPIKEQAIDAMIQQLSKYHCREEEELVEEVLDYLQNYNTVARKDEIEVAVLGHRASGEQKKKIDKALNYLMLEEKIIHNGRNYEFVDCMEWSDTLVGACNPIDFKVPYLDDYAHFLKGQLMLIGSSSKFGKTTLCMNLIKLLVAQGIKPYYIYNENGSGFIKSAFALGLKDGDFWFDYCPNPEKIQIKPNSIVIYDWINPRNFAATDKLYEGICEKLHKTKSFMMAMAQLRQQDGEWFAPDLVVQYPALACKYLYSGTDGLDTYFEITHVRDAKFRGKSMKIPCSYDWDTKIVSRIEDKPVNID
jgi:hypothetical protein